MNLRRAARRAGPILGTLAGLAFLAYVARPHWSAARDAAGALDAAWIAVAVVALAVHLGIAFLIWRTCLAASGVRIPPGAAADTWVPSLLARYVPGRVWAHGVRLMLARRAGIALPDVTTAVGWEILMAVLGAGLVALVAAPGSSIDPRLRLAVVAVVLTCSAALVAAQLLAARGDRFPLLQKLGLRQPLSHMVLVRLAAAHLTGWAIYGVAHWALARAIGPIAIADFRIVLGGVALAWLGGYLAVFTPAGVGVREGLLAILLAPLLGAGPVVLLAGLARLTTIGLEILLFLSWSARRIVAAKAPRNAAGG